MSSKGAVLTAGGAAAALTTASGTLVWANMDRPSMEGPSTLEGEEGSEGQRQRAAMREKPLNDFLAGFITSSAYTSATYPIHRVKILLQTQDSNPSVMSGGRWMVCQQASNHAWSLCTHHPEGGGG